MTRPIRQLLEPWDVADVLAVSRKTVYKLARSGILPSVKFGGALRFDPADVDAFIAKARREATPARRSKQAAK